MHLLTALTLNIVCGSLSRNTLNQVLEYIKTHLSQDLTLTQLAAIAEISPNYFTAQFKQSREHPKCVKILFVMASGTLAFTQ